jgi:hypothetical protein
MSLSYHPYINANRHKYLGGLFHHLVKEKTNTKNGNNKNAWQVTILEGLDVNRYTHLLDEGKKCLDMDILIYEYIGKWECQSFLFKISFIICETTWKLIYWWGLRIIVMCWYIEHALINPWKQIIWRISLQKIIFLLYKKGL